MLGVRAQDLGFNASGFGLRVCLNNLFGSCVLGPSVTYTGGNPTFLVSSCG